MVGLVIVSHSRKLADVLIDFIKEVHKAEIPLVAAGGVGDDFATMGTDATDIMHAVQSVYSDDGVIVLMDMGSAILSTELAIDFLPESQAARVHICAAPLVEGALAAAVQIGLNASLEQVVEEALGGLEAKQVHLKDKHDKALNFEVETEVAPRQDMQQKILTIQNIHGLHARPAAKLVQVTGKFEANVYVSNITRNKGPVSGRSLNKLSSLGILQGDQVLVSASGTQAQDVLQAISLLVEQNFWEPCIAMEKPVIKRKRPDGLIGVSEGIAVGRAVFLQHQSIKIEKKIIQDTDKEIKKLQKAVNEVKKDIAQRIQGLTTLVANEELEIFEAHLVLLDDPEFAEDSIRLIREHKYAAAFAWNQCVQTVKEAYTSLTDAYLQMRAADVQDVGNQVLQKLLGIQKRIVLDGDDPLILFSRSLAPSEIASLDISRVQGIVTGYGGPTSHMAIISKALGIPAVSGFLHFENIKENTYVAINGFNGEVVCNPNQEILQHYNSQRDAWVEKKQALLKNAVKPAVTKDGSEIAVYANISTPLEAETAIASGAEGIGLLRTEFLFLERSNPPSEEEQYQSFVRIAAIVGEKPILIRTFDLGGDKMLPYMMLSHEENPFLGVRGVRLYEQKQELFAQHIRAILRAGEGHDFKIMFPMIAQSEELLATRKKVAEIHEQLRVEKIPHKWPIEIGVMIETPAAVLIARELVKNSDFFSIGTNDLTQYVMAAERGNPLLVSYSDPLHPAVLRSMKSTIEAAHNAGIKVSVCGEIGSESLAIPLLIGMGIDKISLNPGKIPEVKQCVRNVSKQEEMKRAEEVLLLDTTREVRSILAETICR